MTTETITSADVGSLDEAIAEVHPLQFIKDNYDNLIIQRDEAYKVVEPFEAELTQVNAQLNALGERKDELVKRIDAITGTKKFLAVKSAIAACARALSKPGGLLAAPEATQ